MIAAVRRRLRGDHTGDARRDSGTTLIELVVGMSVMAVFMTMFSASITLMYRSVSKVESLNVTSAQLSTAFNRMDNTVRYASAVSAPGKSGADWYVELQTVNTGTKICTQLRISNQQLQQRTWTVLDNGSASGTSEWVPLASGITNGAVAVGDALQPFTRLPATGNITFQQLRLRLNASSGSNESASTSLTDVTFTALNSTLSTPSTGICAEVARS